MIIKGLILLLTLVCLTIAPKKFCSVMCAHKYCTGNEANKCNGNCMNNWIVNATTCEPNNGNDYYQLDTSSDLGGSLVVNSTTNISTTSTFCSPFDLYGPFVPADTVTITSNIGIIVAYYTFTLYFGFLTVDSSGSFFSSYWDSNTKFTLTFSNSTGLVQTDSYDLKGSTRVEYQNFCFRSSRSEYWNRVEQAYTYNVQNEPFLFSLSNDEGNASAIWGVKEFVIVYRICHWACTQCFGAGTTQCS